MRIVSVGTLSTIKMVLSVIPGSGGTMFGPRTYFRIGPADTGGATSPAMAALKV